MYQTPVLLASAKFLFGKRAVDPTAVGKKVTLDEAREVRKNMIPLGEVTLK